MVHGKRHWGSATVLGSCGCIVHHPTSAKLIIGCIFKSRCIEKACMNLILSFCINNPFEGIYFFCKALGQPQTQYLYGSNECLYDRLV